MTATSAKTISAKTMDSLLVVTRGRKPTATILITQPSLAQLTADLLKPDLPESNPPKVDFSESNPPELNPPKVDLPKLDLRVDPLIDRMVSPKIDPRNPNIPIESDPELGTLRTLSPPTPIAPVPNVDMDPELGLIRILPASPPKIRSSQPERAKSPRSKSLYLLGRLDYFQNSNVLSSAPLTSDASFRSSLTLYYAPALGPKTYLLATAESSVLRYGTISRLNYDDLRFKVGIYQQLTPRMSGELGWSYQQLTAAKEGWLDLYQGTQFFKEHSLRFDLTRQDPLTTKLKLATGYQFRWNLTGDVEKYDRIMTGGFVSMSYAMSHRTQVGVDYQATWTHFLQQERDDISHYVGTRLSYKLNDRVSINAFGGRIIGSSSDPRLDLNSWVFGMGIGFNLPIF